MRRSKSHTPAALVAALNQGGSIWELDTNDDGEDDILIGSAEEVLADVFHHFEIDALPERWALRKLDSAEVGSLRADMLEEMGGNP